MGIALDSLLRSNRVLKSNSWVYFRLYKNPQSENNWKNNLDWYHQTLISVVRPVVNSNMNIAAIFFGFYGPQAYGTPEGETYKKTIENPGSDLVFIRLRLAVKTGKKNNVKNAIVASIESNRNLVWDYEMMITYNVVGDLGDRFGSNLNDQTLRFIRYWDASCRFILSVLEMPGNWKNDLDVWGIPHLTNNSLGAWLRPERGPVSCPNCQSHMYMRTSPCLIHLPTPTQELQIPQFVFICPLCGNQIACSSNI